MILVLRQLFSLILLYPVWSGSRTALVVILGLQTLAIELLVYLNATARRKRL